MRKFVLAALAAIALVCPRATFAQAQMVTGYAVPQQSGTLTTINTDSVTVNLYGGSWATARFKVTSAGTATATAQVSLDWGVNWIASAFAKRLSTVSANPTVQAITSSTLVTGDEWEVPLPANATQFRLVCGATGTATNVSLYGGSPYVPGEPNTAVLFDVTSAVNTAIDTGTLDLSGWSFLSASYTTPAGGSGTISAVDDAGTSTNYMTVPASSTGYAMFSVQPNLNTTAIALPATGFFGTAPILRRMRFQSAGVAALTSRIRLEARR